MLLLWVLAVVAVGIDVLVAAAVVVVAVAIVQLEAWSLEKVLKVLAKIAPTILRFLE